MSDQTETYEERLTREQHAWLDSLVAEGRAEYAYEIAKRHSGEEICARWGLTWLRKQGFASAAALEAHNAYQRFEKARLEFNRANNLAPESVNKFLQDPSGLEMYREVCRLDADAKAARRRQ